ncbi:MAG TPA: glycosyltransferase [Anaerolineaceae bacterium]
MTEYDQNYTISTAFYQLYWITKSDTRFLVDKNLAEYPKSHLDDPGFLCIIDAMGWIGIGIVAFAAVSWWALILMPWRSWRVNHILPLETPAEPPLDLSDVTVVIPARNEAGLIGRTLASLGRQGDNLRIILVDDHSSDGTARTAEAAGIANLQIVPGKPLPPGWSGKVWAMAQGINLVQTRYTLFLDADILLEAGVIAALRSQSQQGYGLVSVMAALSMESFWEKLLMPAFIYFFKLLYPFSLANSPDRRFAAAAGGCVLLETRCLAQAGGLETIHNAVIDDCALARQVKRAGFRTWIGQSLAVGSVRRYQGLSEIWEMVARSAFDQLRYSLFWLGLCTLGLILLFGAPLAGMLAFSLPISLVGLAGWLGMAVSYLPGLQYYRRSPFWVLLLPFAASLYLAMTWTSALRCWRGERTRWKGRIYRR